MPQSVYLPYDKSWKGWTTSQLDGDTLRVRPEIFGAMQEILNLQDGLPDELAAWALRRAGLTAEEISDRTFQNTNIVVDYDLKVFI